MHAVSFGHLEYPSVIEVRAEAELARVGLRVRLQPSTPGRRNRGTNLLAPKQSAASSSLAWANPLALARLHPRPKPHQTELGRWQVTRSTSSKTPRPVRMTR